VVGAKGTKVKMKGQFITATEIAWGANGNRKKKAGRGHLKKNKHRGRSWVALGLEKIVRIGGRCNKFSDRGWGRSRPYREQGKFETWKGEKKWGGGGEKGPTRGMDSYISAQSDVKKRVNRKGGRTSERGHSHGRKIREGLYLLAIQSVTSAKRGFGRMKGEP